MSVQASTTGRVRILTLDRPEARNALDAGTRQELIAKLKDAEQDPAVGAVVLTGAGSAFAAGADLKELLARSSDDQLHFLQPPHIYSTLEELAKPVVAAINGHALGAGLELATACDLRVCSAAAKLGQPEVSLGLIPGGGGTQRLVHLLGAGQAARLVLTGDVVTAEEALRIGLVDVVLPKEETVAKAVELAEAMARHDPAALAAAKRSLLAARGPSYEAGLETEIEEFVRLHARPESRARIKAFLEKK
ncbi:MAG TPA: enoyl-CoA hydratase/isomerase family protein [Candidatus Thermoplasmatota archaeon]|nr:enoyl-CoA hydratase/isomerase family protein [Candidatus Thermoplasmatota archaeon]